MAATVQPKIAAKCELTKILKGRYFQQGSTMNVGGHYFLNDFGTTNC